MWSAAQASLEGFGLVFEVDVEVFVFVLVVVVEVAEAGGEGGCRQDRGGSGTGLPCSSIFMPSERPICARISLISFSDLRPKFLVLSISASVFWMSSPMVAMLAFFRQL